MVLTNQEKQILKILKESKKDAISISKELDMHITVVEMALFSLGAKGLLNVEISSGKPRSASITTKGMEILEEDPNWLYK